ncbi:hypothetical protein KY362_03215 [Candidatus Woesearchaeota archaeon]|nr:hypothetical protein [Candidatus Woesearchaeota archaeon]
MDGADLKEVDAALDESFRKKRSDAVSHEAGPAGRKAAAHEAPEVSEVPETEHLVVSPSLVKSYLVNTLKDVFLLGSLFAALYFVDMFVGREFFEDAFQTLGVPFVWTMYILIGLVVIVFGATFFSTLSLTSYELIFTGDKVKFSYGSFLKVTKETKIANIVRVNYKGYGYLGLGDILVELSGTEEKNMKVRYVSSAKDVCEQVNDLVRMKKGEQAADVVGTGAAAQGE